MTRGSLIVPPLATNRTFAELESVRISRLNESEKAVPEGNRFPLSNVTGTCTWPRTMEAGQRSAGESLQQTMCSPSTDKRGGLNGSTLHSSRTRLALKTKAKSLARVRSAGTLPWLGFDRGQPNRSLLPGKVICLAVLGQNLARVVFRLI